MRQLRLVEYEKIAALAGGLPRRVADGLVIAGEDFAALKTMLLTADDRDDDLGVLLKPCLWNGREALQVRNYAGVIMLPSGLGLEILPKIGRAEDDGSVERARAILLKMLRAWPDGPYRTFEQAALAGGKAPLLEVFITCFLNDVGELIRRGLCSDYVAVEDNQIFLRGKLMLPEHIRRNAARQERFYVRFDEFLADRPENRLVKSALLQVEKWSRDDENQRRRKIHDQAFTDVPPSRDVAADIAACRRDRNLQHYNAALSWCRLLLRGQSPIPQAGSHSCLSILFPMEKLFEHYVAVELRRLLAESGWRVEEQARQRHLVESHDDKPCYTLQPDLLFTKKNRFPQKDRRVVADTKWKRLNSAADVAQEDLYQLFAYGEKYLEEKKLSFLIYPKTDDFRRPPPPFWFRDKVHALQALPYDLEKDECDVRTIMDEWFIEQERIEEAESEEAR